MAITVEQAHAFAFAVYNDIQQYVAAHADEYREWLKANGCCADENEAADSRSYILVILVAAMKVGCQYIVRHLTSARWKSAAP